MSLFDEVDLGLKSGHVEIGLPQLLLGLSLLGHQNRIWLLVVIRGLLGVDVLVHKNGNLFGGLFYDGHVDDDFDGNLDDLLDENFDDFFDWNVNFLLDNLLNVDRFLDDILLIDGPLDDLLYRHLYHLINILDVLGELFVLILPLDLNLDIFLDHSLDWSLDNPLNGDLYDFLDEINNLNGNDSLIVDLLFDVFGNLSLNDILSVDWSVDMVLDFLDDFSLNIDLFFDHLFDFSFGDPFYNLRLFDVFSFDLLYVSLDDLLNIDWLVYFLFDVLLHILDLLDVSILDLLDWNLNDFLYQIIHVFLSLNGSIDDLLYDSFDSIFDEPLDWNLDYFLNVVLVALSYLFDHFLLVDIDLSGENLIGILVLSEILFVDFVNLVNIDWILYDSLDSSLDNLLDWNLSDPVDIDWSLDGLFDWNFYDFLDWNFDDFLDVFLLVNFSNDVSLDNLFNGSLDDDIYVDIDLSVDRNWSLNNDLDFLLDESLIDDGLLGGAVDIHVGPRLLIAGSDLSVLKSGLSDIDILTVSDASVYLVRLALIDLNDDSLPLCNLDHSGLSLLLRDDSWISLSDLGDSEFLLGWVEVGGSVVGVAVVA